MCPVILHALLYFGLQDLQEMELFLSIWHYI